MAARHFAKELRELEKEEETKEPQAPEVSEEPQVPDELQVPDEPLEPMDSQKTEESKRPDGEAGLLNDHLEEPSFLEFTPPPASTFVVPVPQNDEADARARERIEEIFRELEEDALRAKREEEERQARLEEELRQRREEEERRARLEEELRQRREEEERQARLEEEQKAKREEEERRARLEEELRAKREQEEALRAKLEEESKLEPKPEPEPEPEPDPVLASPVESKTERPHPVVQIDPDWLSDIPLDDVESGELALEGATYAPKPEPESDQTSEDDERIPPDKTAELPVRARARLLEEQGRTPQVVREDAPKQGNEQYVASADRRERLEVSTDHASMEVARSNPSVTSTATALATKKRPLGFFARIGAFIARLFHMDD